VQPSGCVHVYKKDKVMRKYEKSIPRSKVVRTVLHLMAVGNRPQTRDRKKRQAYLDKVNVFLNEIGLDYNETPERTFMWMGEPTTTSSQFCVYVEPKEAVSPFRY
jgi:hypothetical protein